jgi:hypothetical protein
LSGNQTKARPHGREPKFAMSDFSDDMFEATIETMRFTCEAHSVMSARLLLFAIGAPNAVDEAAEMVAEKITAFSHAGMAAEQALSDGLGFFAAAERAYRRCATAFMPTAIG